MTERPGAAALLITTTLAGRRRAGRRILVLKLDHFGDFIIGLPALRHLRAAFPGDTIELVCGPWNRATALATGLFDEVSSYTFFPETAGRWRGAPVDHLARFAEIVQGRFDVAIDLRVDPDTRHLLAVVDAGLKCGIGTRAAFPFLDIILPHDVRRRVEEAIAPHLLGPEQFRSLLPVRTAFFHQTDFSVTDRYIAESPGRRLPEGRYRATFGLHLVGPARGLGASVEIEVSTGTGPPVARMLLKRRRHVGFQAAPVLLFESNDDGAEFSFRVHAGGRSVWSGLRFEGVFLAPLDGPRDDPARSRRLPAELHIGEQLSLLVALVAERIGPLYPSAGPDAGARRGAARRIVVAPFSNSETRDWPAEYYRALIDQILAAAETVVILIGTPAQARRVETIRAAAGQPGRVFNMAGEVSWEGLPAVLRSADLVICNNSGVAHLAASEGVRTLAIYSGSHQPREWGPRGEQVTTVTLEVPCSPCGLEYLADCQHGHRCMVDLTPGIVAGQVDLLLAAEPASGARGVMTKPESV